MKEIDGFGRDKGEKESREMYFDIVSTMFNEKRYSIKRFPDRTVVYFRKEFERYKSNLDDAKPIVEVRDSSIDVRSESDYETCRRLAEVLEHISRSEFTLTTHYQKEKVNGKKKTQDKYSRRMKLIETLG